MHGPEVEKHRRQYSPDLSLANIYERLSRIRMAVDREPEDTDIRAEAGDDGDRYAADDERDRERTPSAG